MGSELARQTGRPGRQGAAPAAGRAGGTPALSHPVLQLQRTIGNQAVSGLLKSGRLQVSRPGDTHEREADRVADQVMGMPDAQARHRDAGGDRGSARSPGPGASVATTVRGGQPLSDSLRSYFEPRFGQDFSEVLVHRDWSAAEAARAVNARAFTAGRDIVFGKGQYTPGTPEGKRLLAHELTHVVQQRSQIGGLRLQRQAIPPELQVSVDYSLLSDAELQAHYDLISETLSLLPATHAERAHLEAEAGRIGSEVLRRDALAAGRTFSADAINKMRKFFIDNATSASPLNCIACMNKGLRSVLQDTGQKLGSEVQTTMGELQKSGRAGSARVIEFNDSRGRMTRGVRRPNVLRENVHDVLIEMAGHDAGWSVFGLSIMDGHHSVTLTLDNNDPSAPKVFWSDQWSSRGGWQEFNRTSLDAEITRLTQMWWDGQPVGGKSKTRVTLWRLRQ